MTTESKSIETQSSSLGNQSHMHSLAKTSNKMKNIVKAKEKEGHRQVPHAWQSTKRPNLIIKDAYKQEEEIKQMP